tara:strand:- start:1485 stop:7853 length:6369 start_codon:yes stop_codon:yes gene_type:complete
MGYFDKKRYIVLQDDTVENVKVIGASAYTEPADGETSVARYSWSEAGRLPAVSTDPAATSVPSVSASGKVDSGNIEVSGTTNSNIIGKASYQKDISGDAFIIEDGPADSSRYSFVKDSGTQAQFRATNNGFQKFSYGMDSLERPVGGDCFVRPSIISLKNGNLLSSHIQSKSPPWMWTFLSALRSNTSGTLEGWDNTPCGHIKLSLLDSETKTWSCPNSNVFANYEDTPLYIQNYPIYELSVTGNETLDSMDYFPISATAPETKQVSLTSNTLVQFDDTEEILCIYTGFFGQNITNLGTAFLPAFLCVDVLNEDTSSQNNFCRSEYAIGPFNSGGGVWGVRKSSRSFIRLNSNPARTSASPVSSDVPGLINYYRPLDSTAQALKDGRLVVVILFEDSLWSLVSTDRGKSFEASKIKSLKHPDKNRVQRFGSVNSCLTESGEMVIIVSSPCVDVDGWPESFIINSSSESEQIPYGVLSIFASSNGVNWGAEKNLNKTVNGTTWAEMTHFEMPAGHGGSPTYPFIGDADPFNSYKDNALYCIDADVCKTPGGQILVTACTLNLGGPGNAHSQQLFQRVLSVKEILASATEDDIAKQMPESFDSPIDSLFANTQRLQRAYPYTIDFNHSVAQDDLILNYAEYIVDDNFFDIGTFGYVGQAYWGGIHSFISQDQDFNRLGPPTRIPSEELCYLDFGGGPFKSFGPLGVATCLWRDSVVTTVCDFFEEGPADYPGFAEINFNTDKVTLVPETASYVSEVFSARRSIKSSVKTVFSGGLQPAMVRLPTTLRYIAPSFNNVSRSDKFSFRYKGEPYVANLLTAAEENRFQLGSNGWQVAWDSSKLLPDDIGWFKYSQGVVTTTAVASTIDLNDAGVGPQNVAEPGGSNASRGRLGDVLKLNTNYLTGAATGTVGGAYGSIRQASGDAATLYVTIIGSEFFEPGDFIRLKDSHVPKNFKVFSVTTNGQNQDIVINDMSVSSTKLSGTEILVPKNSGLQSGDSVSFIQRFGGQTGQTLEVDNIQVTSHDSTQDKVSGGSGQFNFLNNSDTVYGPVPSVDGIEFNALAGTISLNAAGGVFARQYLSGTSFTTADNAESQQLIPTMQIGFGTDPTIFHRVDSITRSGGVATIILTMPDATGGITEQTGGAAGMSWSVPEGDAAQDHVFYDYTQSTESIMRHYPNARGHILKYRKDLVLYNRGLTNISEPDGTGNLPPGGFENRSFNESDLEPFSFVCRAVVNVDNGGGLLIVNGDPQFSDLGMGIDIQLVGEHFIQVEQDENVGGGGSFVDGGITYEKVGQKVNLQLRCGRQNGNSADFVAFEVFDALGDEKLVDAVFVETPESREHFQRPFYEVLFSLSYDEDGYPQAGEDPSLTRLMVRPWKQYSDPDMLDDFLVRETTSPPVYETVLESDTTGDNLERIRFGHFQVSDFGTWPLSIEERETRSLWSSFSFCRSFLKNSTAYVKAYSHPDGIRRGSKKVDESSVAESLPLFPIDNNALFVEPDPVSSTAPLAYMRNINGGVFSPTMPLKATSSPSFVDSGISVAFAGLLNSFDRFKYSADSSFRAENIFSLPVSTGWRSSEQTIPYDSGVHPHVAPNNIVHPVPSHYLMFEFEEGIMPEAVSFFGINTDEVKVDFYRKKSINMSYSVPFGFYTTSSLSMWMSPPGSPSGRLFTEWSNNSRTPRPLTDIAWRPNYLFYWDGPGDSTNDGWQAVIGDPSDSSPVNDYFVFLHDDKSAASSSDDIQRTAPFIPGRFKSTEGESYYMVCYDKAVSDASFTTLHSKQGRDEFEGHRYIFKIKDNGVNWIKLTAPIGMTHSFTSFNLDQANLRVRISRFAIVSDRVGTNLPDYWPLVNPSDPDSAEGIQDFDRRNTYPYMVVRLSGGMFYDPDEKFLKLGMMIAGKKIELGSRHVKWDWSYALDFGNALNVGLTGQRRRRRNHKPRKQWSISYEPIKSPPVLTKSLEDNASTQHYNEVRGFGSVRGQFGPNSEQDSEFSQLSWVEVVQRVLNVEVNGQVFALAFEGFQMMCHNSIMRSTTSSSAPQDTTYRNAKYVPALSDPGLFCAVRLIEYGGAQNAAYSSRTELASQDMDHPWQNDTGYTADYSVGYLKEGKRYLTSRPMPVVQIQSLKFSEEL